MVIFGLYSGKLVSRNKVVNIVTRIWQWFMMVSSVSSIAFVLTTGFTASEKWGFELVFKLAEMVWALASVLDMLLMIRGCYSQNGFLNFYTKLDKMNGCLQHLGVSTEDLPPKRQNGFIIGGMVGILTNLAYVYPDLIHTKSGPFHGKRLESMNLTTERLIAVRVCYGWANFVFTAASILVPAYAINVAYLLWCVFDKYNLFLKKVIQSEERHFLETIREHRMTHLKLCNLIETANHSLGGIYGITTGVVVVILLLILYLTSLTIGRPGVAGSLYFGLSFWILNNALLLILTVYFTSQVHNQVRIFSFSSYYIFTFIVKCLVRYLFFSPVTT